MSGTVVRARDLGVPFDGRTGQRNAITDVPGVEVGCATIVRGDGPLVPHQGPVRTGVTAIHPRGREGVGESVSAGFFSFNGNGELTGSHWIAETGSFATPILITNTHAVGDVHRTVIDWMIEKRPDLGQKWILPVVAETWDGILNDANGRHVLAEHVRIALDTAAADTAMEGAVGGGTGMICYGRKGGNGTSSRIVNYDGRDYTVGVFVQANFGEWSELRIRGRDLAENPPEVDQGSTPAGAGSLIVVIGTDAPLLPGQCAALSRRATLGVARTGTTGSHFSGDLFLAFSTGNTGVLDLPAEPTRMSLEYLPWGHLDPFYAAVVQATEEAIVNALVAGRTMVGRDGNKAPGLNLDRVRELFATES